MQLLIQIQLEQPLTLPINYNHILQGIVYHAIGPTELATFVHDTGYQSEERSYKLFQFSQLNGHYRIKDKQITFDDTVWFEVRSLDPQLVLQVKEAIDTQGVTFYSKKYTHVRTQLRDETVEAERIIAVDADADHGTRHGSGYEEDNLLQPEGCAFPGTCGRKFCP